MTKTATPASLRGRPGRNRSHTARVNSATHRTLSDLAAQTGNSFGEIIERAVERYRREDTFARAAGQLQVIHDDPESRAVIEAEYAMFDAVAVDVLDHDE